MIEAIRLFREHTDLGLKEAKEAVEALARGGMLEAGQGAAGPLSADEIGRVLEQVQNLLRDGDKVSAIRIYRESADVSLTKAKDVIERVEAALKGIPLPPVVVWGTPSAVKPVAAPRQPRLGLWITLSVLIFVGGLLALVFFAVGGPFNSLLVPSGPAILLPVTGGLPQVGAVFYEVNTEARRLVVFEAPGGSLRWKSEPLPGDGFADALAGDADLIYLAVEDQLLAYRREDGSLAWQTTMPDTLGYGNASLLVIGGRVVTMNLDQSIQAYDTTSGGLVWHRRLQGYDRELRTLGQALVVFDQVGEDYTYSLVFLDPLDGSEQRVLTPTCPLNEYSSESIDPSSGMLVDAVENSLYLVYDSSPGCIQRLDLATGTPSWQTLDEDWYTFSADGFQGLLTDGQLIFANEGRLLAVDRQTGMLSPLLEEEDYEFIPLAAHDGGLLLRARWSRGSERFELRSLGGTPWVVDLGDSLPIDPPDETIGLIDSGDSAYTWRVVGEKLVLIHFEADPHQLRIQRFDLQDGSLTDLQIVPLKGVSGDFYSIPSVIGWQEEWLFLSLDTRIYCVNVLTGEVLFRFQ